MTVIDLKPPLRGYMTTETLKVAYLPAVMSDEQGAGHVGRLLLELQDAYDVVIVPGIVSDRLRGMVQRRGYHPETHYSREMDEYVECWVYRKSAPA